MAQFKHNGENNTYINKSMVVSIVSLATKEIDGVLDIYRAKRLTLRRLFNKNIGKGVLVKYTDLGVVIDIFVILSTSAEVSEVVYRIQQNVKNSIASVLPIKIKAINVHIMDAENKDSL